MQTSIQEYKTKRNGQTFKVGQTILVKNKPKRWSSASGGSVPMYLSYPQHFKIRQLHINTNPTHISALTECGYGLTIEQGSFYLRARVKVNLELIIKALKKLNNK